MLQFNFKVDGILPEIFLYLKANTMSIVQLETRSAWITRKCFPSSCFSLCANWIILKRRKEKKDERDKDESGRKGKEIDRFAFRCQYVCFKLFALVACSCALSVGCVKGQRFNFRADKISFLFNITSANWQIRRRFAQTPSEHTLTWRSQRWRRRRHLKQPNQPLTLLCLNRSINFFYLFHRPSCSRIFYSS